MPTIPITNFSGRLTRIVNGDLNSGFAKFTTSFGYDPFSKPMNLTWLETPTSVAGINNIPLTGKVLPASVAGANVHVVTGGGNWYQIRSSSQSNPNVNSIIGVSSIAQGSRLRYGASMEFFGSVVGTDLEGNLLGKMYLAEDDRIEVSDPNGGNQANVGNPSFISGNYYHPLKQFAGSLVFGNGPTVGKISSTGTITSSILNVGTGNIYSELNPALGTQPRVIDIEVSPSNDYITLGTANYPTKGLRIDVSGYDTLLSIPFSDGKLVLWNGTDAGPTAATSIPNYVVSALETYFKETAFFAADGFGATVNLGSGKVLSLPNNVPPLPNAVAVNGNFLTWACSEVDATNRYMSLYYFGSLDQENPTGLYRLLRWTTTQSTGQVMNVVLNLLVANKHASLDGNNAVTTFSYGKHYIGLGSAAAGGGAIVGYLLSFLVTSTDSGTPQLGVYETQTQLFSKRVGVSQIRVYTEPTVSGNAFKLDMIGSDGAVISNGTFNYTFGEISDPNSGSTALERINFSPTARTQYALGIRITNTGTTNFTIKKIEVDYEEKGK